MWFLRIQIYIWLFYPRAREESGGLLGKPALISRYWSG
jgi:hypothetical protein